MIDFHSHILPGMDDGSRDVPESLKLLVLSAQQGIETIIATPHFYHDRESVADFLNRRQASYEELMKACKLYDELPEIRLGAEVAFFSGMSRLMDLEKLRMEGTDCILIEMPFSIWTAGTISEIFAVISKTNLIPILAHVERYPDFLSEGDKLGDLIGMGVLFQLNGEFFLSSKSKRHALNTLRHGDYYLLGSDMHNLTSRPPNLGEAFSVIERKLGIKHLSDMMSLGEELLLNGSGSRSV